MDLSIIIVNWNSKEFVRKCLASIEAQTADITCEIVVIDSGSFDGCGEMLDEVCPTVKFVQSERNVGFAKANNEAVKYCTGAHLLFLNPDAVVKGGAIATMFRVLTSRRDAGAVGPRLLNADGTIQSTCVRCFPTLLNQLMESEALRRAFPRSPWWGMRALLESGQDPLPVDAVSGACLMVRRVVFDEIGGFNEDYFMYSEDIELCFQARRAGWVTYFVPNAEVTHYGGESTGRCEVSDFANVMMVESRYRFFRNTRSERYGHLYRMLIFVGSGCRLVGLLPLLVGGLVTRRPGRLGCRLRKSLARVRWALGGERWVKTYPCVTE